MKIPFVDDFEIETKAGVKCSEKAVRYREEGNKLFQADKCTQVIRVSSGVLNILSQVHRPTLDFQVSQGTIPG